MHFQAKPTSQVAFNFEKQMKSWVEFPFFAELRGGAGCVSGSWLEDGEDREKALGDQSFFFFFGRDVWHAGSYSFLTRDWTRAPCTGSAES